METNLKSLRNEANLSLRELSKNVNIDFGALSKLESGLRTMGNKYSSILTQYFNVSTDYLLARSDKYFIVEYGDTNGGGTSTMDASEYFKLKATGKIQLIVTPQMVIRKVIDKSYVRKMIDEHLHQKSDDISLLEKNEKDNFRLLFSLLNNLNKEELEKVISYMKFIQKEND